MNRIEIFIIIFLIINTSSLLGFSVNKNKLSSIIAILLDIFIYTFIKSARQSISFIGKFEFSKYFISIKLDIVISTFSNSFNSLIKILKFSFFTLKYLSFFSSCNSSPYLIIKSLTDLLYSCTFGKHSLFKIDNFNPNIEDIIIFSFSFSLVFFKLSYSCVYVLILANFICFCHFFIYLVLYIFYIFLIFYLK